MFSCSDCQTKFITFGCLRKHLKTVHNKVPKELETSNHTCPHCPETFRTKSLWQKHIRETHGQSRRSHLICPLCSEDTKSHKSLIDHLVKDHQLVIQLEELEFDTIEDFNGWKITMERDLNVMYVKGTAGKKLRDGIVRTYYHCHRSYSCRAKGNVLRKAKAIGSNKINRACPGVLKVTEEAHKVTVVHYATHLGHTCDIGRLNLTSDEKMFIAGKLSEGLSINQIITEIRESATDANFNRLHLLRKKDVYNIMRDFSLPVKKIKDRKKTSEADKLFDDIVTAHRGDAKTNLDTIKIAHEASRDVKGCQFVYEYKGWLVPESFEQNVLIQALTAGCPGEVKCVQKCEECDICIHSYKCSCIDNKIFLNICKHIHTVHAHRVNNPLEEYFNVLDEQKEGTGRIDVDLNQEGTDVVSDKQNEAIGDIEVDDNSEGMDAVAYDQDEVFSGIKVEDNEGDSDDVDDKQDEAIGCIKVEDTEEQRLTENDDIRAKLGLIQRLYKNVELKQPERDEVVSHLDEVISLLSQNIFKKGPVLEKDVLYYVGSN